MPGKISEDTLQSNPADAALIPIVEAGANKHTTVSAMRRLTIVTMPANGAASGAVGQIASDGVVLAIYIGLGGNMNWLFLNGYQIDA